MVKQDDSVIVPRAAKAMYELGPNTENAIKAFFFEQQPPLLLDDFEVGDTYVGMSEMAESLRKFKWTDDEGRKLFAGLNECKIRHMNLDFSQIYRWIIAHGNEEHRVEKVFECINTVPPDDLDIRKVQSLAGAQKTVFLASWKLTQKDVICKRIKGCPEVLHREMEAFPLRNSHPNIIETYQLHNRHNELFLIEELLEAVLNDHWRADGLQEVTNLLYDIGSALKYLQEHNRAHGDVKPDNIGRMHNRYILLDFGICRPLDSFVQAPHATGSLRTRAPELLVNGRYTQPTSADIWALGATAFSALLGRFPLLDKGEEVPRKSNSDARADFEAMLKTRVEGKWDEFVSVDGLPPELKELMTRMLERDPTKRIKATELVNLLEKKFGAFIARSSEKAARDGRFSPSEELIQMKEFRDAIPPGAIIPIHKFIQFKERLRELQATEGFSKEQHELVQSLMAAFEGRK